MEDHTVDGSEVWQENHLGCIQPRNGIKYQPQLVSRISEPRTLFHHLGFRLLNTMANDSTTLHSLHGQKNSSLFPCNESNDAKNNVGTPKTKEAKLQKVQLSGLHSYNLTAHR